MAKPLAKRRGITLGPHDDSAAVLERLNPQGTTSDPSPSSQTALGAKTLGGDLAAIVDGIAEQLDQLRLGDADRDARWHEQTQRLQDHLRGLEAQRAQFAHELRQLQDSARTGKGAGRIGLLLALMAVAGVAALGHYTWPRLQGLAGDLDRLSQGVTALGPNLKAVGGELSALTADLQGMGDSLASLRTEVATARSDLGSLRHALDNSPRVKGPAQVETRARQGDPRALSRNATSMGNPYGAMRPGMPW